MGFLLARIIPPARVSVFLEDAFGLKRFRRRVGLLGFPKERQNRDVRDRQYDDKQLKKEE